MRRRTYLLASAAAIGALSGCAGDGGGRESDDESTSTDTQPTDDRTTTDGGAGGAATESPTATPTGSGTLSFDVRATGAIDEFETLVVAVDTVQFTDPLGGTVSVDATTERVDLAATEHHTATYVDGRSIAAGPYDGIALPFAIPDATTTGGDSPTVDVPDPFTVDLELWWESFAVDDGETKYVTVNVGLVPPNEGGWTVEMDGISGSA